MRAPEAPAVARLAAALREVVGAGGVVDDPDAKASFEHDLTGRFRGDAALVVLPSSTAELSAVMAVCRGAQATVVFQGGNTGLVGGAIPCPGEVVVSLRRLASLEPVDPLTAQVSAGAGVTLAALHDHLRGTGLRFPIDHAARDAATIGGMTATNAGGPYAMRYGTMRRQVVGVEAVLADGRVLSRMGGLLKDNAGYDFGPMLVGSEGTLAAITAVRLQLVPEHPYRVTMLVGLATMKEAVDLVSHLRGRLASMEAADFFQADGMELVCRTQGLTSPFPSGAGTYVIFEFAGETDPTEEVAAALDDWAGRVDDVAVADDTARRAALWAFRERHNEAVRSLGVPLKLDVSIAPRDVPRFEAELERLLQRRFPESQTILYGHLGDGNVHVNVVGGGEAVEDAVLRLVGSYGGSISAEHGIGRLKAPWLSYCRSADEISWMRQMKLAFDPAGILAPGRVLSV